MTTLFLEKPHPFHSKIEVSTVFMEHEETLLLLCRASHKVAPNKWGIPGGKLEVNETPLDALIREIKEELQLSPAASELHFLRTVFVQTLFAEYKLHLFHWTLSHKPTVILNSDEHQDLIWQPIKSFEALPLLEGQAEAFRLVYPC